MSLNLNVLIIVSSINNDDVLIGTISSRDVGEFIDIFDSNSPIVYGGITYRIESYSYSPSEVFNLFNIRLILKKIRD